MKRHIEMVKECISYLDMFDLLALCSILLGLVFGLVWFLTKEVLFTYGILVFAGFGVGYIIARPKD